MKREFNETYSAPTVIMGELEVIRACKKTCSFQHHTAAKQKSKALQAADRRLYSKGRVPSKWARVLVSTPRKLQRRRSQGQSAAFHAPSESLSVELDCRSDRSPRQHFCPAYPLYASAES